MLYVYAYDNVWKDWMCCQCQNLREACYVENRWNSFNDRSRVSIEIDLIPERKATMYEVRKGGWIGLIKK